MTKSTFIIDDDVWNEFRIHCLENDMSLNEGTNKAIKEYIKHPPKRNKR